MAVLSACFLMMACHRDKNILPAHQMEELLYDYHLAKSTSTEVKNMGSSVNRNLLVSYVLHKHHVDEAVFDSSMLWYSNHPDELVKIYDHITARLKKQVDNLTYRMTQISDEVKSSVEGDSVDVWGMRRLYKMTGKQRDNRLVFSIMADQNFQERDTLRWNARFRFMNEGTERAEAPTMAMLICYKNDSILGVQQRITESGEYSLTLYSDTMGGIRSVDGFIYYPEHSSAEFILLDCISLMRMHALMEPVVKKAPTEAKTETLQEEVVPTVAKPKIAPTRRQVVNEQPSVRQPSKPKPADKNQVKEEKVAPARNAPHRPVRQPQTPPIRRNPNINQPVKEVQVDALELEEAPIEPK